MEVPPILKIAVAAAAAIVGMAGGYLVSDHSGPEKVLLTEDSERESDARLAAQVQAVLVEPSDRKRLKELWKVALELEPRRIPFFLEQLRLEPDLREKMVFELLGEWALVDPQAAFAYASSMNRRSRGRGVDAVTVVWADTDEAAATAWIENLPKGDIRNAAEKALHRSIGKKDLPRFASMLVEGKMEGDYGVARLVWIHWLAKDRELALREATRLSQHNGAAGAFGGISSAVGSGDPKVAIAWASQLPVMRNRALYSIAHAMAESHPEEAIAIAEMVDDGTQKLWIRLTGMHNWVKSDYSAALAWIQKVDDPKVQEMLLPMAMEQWIAQDTNAAMQYLLANHRDGKSGETMQRTMSRWLNADFEKAERWLKDNPSLLSMNEIRDIVFSASYSSPVNALKLISHLPEGSEANLEAYNSIARRWASVDPVNAAAQLDTLEGGAKEYFLRGYISGLAGVAPEEAGRLVSELPDGALKYRAAESVASSWGEGDPKAALEWVATIPGASLNENSAGTIMRRWASNDPYAASQYLTTLPNGASRDAMVGEFLYGMAEENPEAAIRWGAAIADEKKRLNGFRRVLSTWFEHDPAAARRWVEASTEPADWKERMLKGR